MLLKVVNLKTGVERETSTLDKANLFVKLSYMVREVSKFQLMIRGSCYTNLNSLDKASSSATN